VMGFLYCSAHLTTLIWFVGFIVLLGEIKMNTSAKITHEGILKLNEMDIPCYVLEDGTRVLSGRGMQEALKMVDEQETQTSGSRLKRHLNQESLKPFIYKDKDEEHFEPIICYKGETKVHGYEATVLVDICDAFLQARKEIELSSRQNTIANQCEVLIRAFAKVGITALVDEATGYQDIRAKDKEALQKLLDKFLLIEHAKWAKKFPDEFYLLLFKLKGWTVSEALTKRPSVVGTYTNNIVYERIAPGILDELRKRNPVNENKRRIHKHHQYLTEDVGHPELQNHLAGVIALMRISQNWEQFMLHLDKAYTRFGDTMPIEFV